MLQFVNNLPLDDYGIVHHNINGTSYHYGGEHEKEQPHIQRREGIP